MIVTSNFTPKWIGFSVLLLFHSRYLAIFILISIPHIPFSSWETSGIYHELSQIEDRFRLMKGNLETRPIFCRTPEHISAHLVLCAVALIIFVLIQHRIKESGLVEKGKEQMWFSGLSGKRLQRALNLWKVDSLPQGYYRFNDIDDEDLKLVLDAFKIKLEPKLYTAGELREIKGAIRLF